MIARSPQWRRYAAALFLIRSIVFGDVVITTANDENNGSLDPASGSGTSLREAVLHAPDGSVIGFAPALDGQTLVLTLGQITVGKSLAINASPLAAGVTVSGNHTSRLFSVSSSKTVSLTALDLIDGDASGDGGAILNAGNLTLDRCELSSNEASDGGGAIENSGTLTLTACTLAGNTAAVGGGAIEHASGTLTATNCTFSGNSAEFGGAIDGDGSSTIRLYSCTVSGNHATNDGGGIEETTGTLLLENTIVAGNTAVDQGSDLKASSINTQAGVNLVSSIAGLGGSFSGIVANPNLAALGENGGRTRTMLPLAGSPAVDAGGATALTLDQRGLPRIGGAAVDIGAAEVQAAEEVPDRWELLAETPFPYGVSCGGGLATDGTFIYAADFSGDEGYDFIDLNGNNTRDGGEYFWQLGIPNASVRFARFDPAAGTWQGLPTIPSGGFTADALGSQDFSGSLFHSGGDLYYYQFRSGPLSCVLHRYNLSSFPGGAWEIVWDKDFAAALLERNAGMTAVETPDGPVLLHSLGNGARDFARTRGLGTGGQHVTLTPNWPNDGATFSRNGSWEYDLHSGALYHLSGDQLLAWSPSTAYPNASFLTTVPVAGTPLAIHATPIPSLKSALGWDPGGTLTHPGASLWGNSITILNAPSTILAGPAGEDSGANVVYLVRGETAPDGWPFNEGRGYITNGDFARWFPETGHAQTLDPTPFHVGKGSDSVYLDGYLYLTQGETLSSPQFPGYDGIRKPGKGFARFRVKGSDYTEGAPLIPVGEYVQDHFASVTASSAAEGDVSDLFDRNWNTPMITDGVNPAVVTVTFNDVTPVGAARAAFGSDAHQWTLDAANTAADLAAESGSFIRVFGPAPVSGDGPHWREWNSTPVSRRIFRFTVQRVAGAPVEIRELELQRPKQIRTVEVGGLPVDVNDLGLLPDSPVIVPGQTLDMTAELSLSLGPDRHDVSSLAQWESSAPAVATVNAAGQILAITTGQTTLTARFQGFTGRTVIEVVDPQPRVVTTAADTGPGSLRETVALAPAGSTITFAPALDGQTISLTSPVVLDRDLMVDGSARINLALSGGGLGGIFTVNAGTTVTLCGLTLCDGNRSAGGAIHNSGNLTLQHCEVRENRAGMYGGGIFNAASAVLDIRDCEIAENHAEMEGGGLFSEGTATLTRTLLIRNLGGNEDGGTCGGISSTGSLSLFDSVVRSNGAFGSGAGIGSFGSLVLERCTFEDNETFFDGDGGGLLVSGGGGTIKSCTFAANRCQYDGGGIFHWAGTLAIANTTLSGNFTDYEYGGGLYTRASANLTSCTIASNEAGEEGGGIYVANNGGSLLGQLSLTNSIIADNQALTSGADLRGAIAVQGGVNLLSSLDGVVGSFTGIVAAPGLGPLADHGGPTWTMLPLAGSPAIDAGGSTTLTADQRGLPRVVGAKVDIGAVEVQEAGEDTQPPSRPLQLTLSGKTATTVSLSWDAATDDVGLVAYDVFRDGVLAGSSTSNGFTCCDLEPDRSYTFRVKARDGSGNLSPPSNALLATPQAAGLLTPPEQVRTEFRAVILNYNPSIYAGGQLVPSDTYYHNRDVGELTAQFIDLLRKASGGQVNWSVSNRYDLDEWPAPEGTPSPLFDASNSVSLVSGGYHYPASYQAIIHDPRFDIAGMINRGELDAVWMFGPLGIDFSETSMVGPTAYYINGRAIIDPTLNRNAVVYGFGKSQHQGVGFMCENTAHMTEVILNTRHQPGWPRTVSSRTFNTLNMDNPARALVTTLVGDWTHFVQAEASSWDPILVAPGASQCGLSHYPPTSLYNYNWNTFLHEFDGAGPFKTYDGTWQSVGGEFRVLSGDGVKVLAIDSLGLSDSLGAYHPAESFSDADVELSVRVVNGTTPSHAGFLFRVSQCAAGPNQVKGYYLGLSPAQDQVILAKLDHAFIPLASVPVALDAGVNYRLRLEARGSSIKAYLDDSLTPLLSHEDPGFITGGFGLTTYGTEAYFDKLNLVSHVTSTADKWYGYPDLQVEPRDLSPLEWDGEAGGVWSAMDGYYAWWWEHLPKNGGGHYATDLGTGQSSLLLNTWWPYVFDHNRFNVTRPFPDIAFPPEDVTSPSTPAGVEILALSDSKIAVAWNPATDNVGVTRYAVYRDGAFLRKTTRTNLTDSRLPPGSSHTYEIMACDGSGNVSAAAAVIGTTLSSGSALLINGGFETVPPDASGWSPDAFRPADAQFTWEPAGIGRNGSRSAAITATGFNDARWIQTVDGLVPGARYWLTGWIKGENIVPEPGRTYGANLSLFEPAVGTPGNLTGTFDWQRVSLSFVAPGSGTVTVTCRIGYFGNLVTGKAWFDDIAVVRYPDSRLVDPQVLPDGRFRFVLQAPQPATYTLQKSYNLNSWTNLRSFQVLHPDTEIIEPPDPAGSAFYRTIGD